MALTQFQNTEEIGKDVELLVNELENLRKSYEQYFLGLERKEPSNLREKVVNLIRKYSGLQIKNARIKFRYQQTVARYNTYTTYWDRVLREIEEGSYERDVFKYNADHQTDGKAPTPAQNAKKESAKDPILILFDQYVAAREKCKESIAGLTPEKFRKAIEAQIEAVKKQTNAGNVRLAVAIEGGKSKIKAVPLQSKK